ncbi:MAG: hypothetical protein Kow00128_04320 [Deltaproteobacteria bacterium]
MSRSSRRRGAAALFGALLLFPAGPAGATPPGPEGGRPPDLDRLAGIEQAIAGRDRSMLPSIRKWADGDPSERVRERSLGALTLLADREAEPLIGDRLAKDPSGRVRRAAAEAAGVLSLPSLRSAIADRLARDPDPLVRAECARALGRIPGGDDSPLLVALVTDSSPEVRALCAEALAVRKPRDAMDLLRTVARQDPSVLVRVYAVRGLARTDPSGSVALFRHAWKESEDPDLRMEAFQGLLRAGGDEPLIEAGIADSDERVRFLAFRAWLASRFPPPRRGEKPSASAESIRRLTGFLTDPLRGIRELAREEMERQGFRLRPSGFGYAVER